MSYILEALKKAEAERQMGKPPGLHAQPVFAPPLARRRSAPGLRWFMAGALGAGLLGLTVVAWQLFKPPALDVRAQAVAVAVPTQGQPTQAQDMAKAAAHSETPREPAPAPEPAMSARKAAPPPFEAPARVSAIATPSPPRVKPPALVPTQEPVPTPPVQKPPAKASAPILVAAVRPMAEMQNPPEPGPMPPPAPRAAAPAAAPAPEDSLPSLAELPDAVQKEVPQFAIKGYIYSKNEADRILLVDKRLLHEGDEVAPGLRLEKLLPRAAVLSFKGYRYRFGY